MDGGKVPPLIVLTTINWELFMSKKGLETVSCGRANRKLRGENENARYSHFEKEYQDTHPDKRPRHVLNRVFRGVILEGIEDAFDTSVSSDRFHLLCRVDPELKQKVTDRGVFAQACDCGCVSVDRYGRLHFNLLPRSVRRKRHQERVARRNNALDEIAS